MDPLALLGALLWFFPGTVANKVVTGPSAESGPVGVRPIEVAGARGVSRVIAKLRGRSG